MKQMLSHTDDLSKDIILKLSKEHGNAFYLLDSVRFRNNFQDLMDAFLAYYEKFNIAYSYKTNYIPKLCNIVNELGGYAEVVSDMEMEIALRCGVPPERIIWNGPIKSRDKSIQLLIAGGMVNIDSLQEAEFIAEMANRYPEYSMELGIRCNFDIGDGVISRFGFDVEGDDFHRAVELLNKKENICISNLQCHFANRDCDFWPKRAKGMVQLVQRMQGILGYKIRRIDLGGGIYGRMPDTLKYQFQKKIPDYKEYAKAVMLTLTDYFSSDSGPEILIEPGTALAGDSMKFVCRVEHIKSIRGKTFITVLGSQKNISMVNINPPIEVIHMSEDGQMYNDADIVGYTCIESDVLYKGFSGRIAVGDYIVFENCGSYSIVMKPPFIMENFPVLDICGESVEIIKKQECFDDLFRTYYFENTGENKI